MQEEREREGHQNRPPCRGTGFAYWNLNMVENLIIKAPVFGSNLMQTKSVLAVKLRYSCLSFECANF